MGYEELKIEGRNAVLEAFRSGKTIDKLFVLDGCQDGPVRTIVREAKKHDTIVHFVEKERLDQLSETKKHQGVIAVAAAYEYAEVEDMLKLAFPLSHALCQITPSRVSFSTMPFASSSSRIASAFAKSFAFFASFRSSIFAST